jgi:hypothetical protein
LHEPWGQEGEWQLFNLEEDPAELRDLSAEEPGKKAELLAGWGEYAEQFNVIPANRQPFEQMPKALPFRGDPQTNEYPLLFGPPAQQYRQIIEMYEEQVRRYYSWRW